MQNYNRETPACYGCVDRCLHSMLYAHEPHIASHGSRRTCIPWGCGRLGQMRAGGQEGEEIRAVGHRAKHTALQSHVCRQKYAWTCVAARQWQQSINGNHIGVLLAHTFFCRGTDHSSRRQALRALCAGASCMLAGPKEAGEGSARAWVWERPSKAFPTCSPLVLCLQLQSENAQKLDERMKGQQNDGQAGQEGFCAD